MIKFKVDLSFEDDSLFAEFESQAVRRGLSHDDFVVECIKQGLSVLEQQQVVNQDGLNEH